MNPRKTAALLSKTPAGQQAMAEALGLKVAAGDDLPTKVKVAILIPAYRGICTEVQLALKEMEAYSSQFCTTERIELSKPIIHSCRNKLASLALDREATHLLWCDDDMLPQPDALVRLLRHEKDIIGGLFTTRKEPAHLVASMLNEEGEFEWLREAPSEGLVRVDSCGTGFTLVSRRVMELIAKSWLACEWEREFWQPPTEVWIREHERRAKSMEVLFFRYLMNAHGQEVGEDLSFFLNAKRCGFEVHVDCSVRVGHLGQKVFLPSVQTPAGVVPALASHFLPPVKAEVAAPSLECPEPWHWHCYDQMTTEVEVLDFLESLVKMLKPKVVVETGTYLGIGTVHLARGAERVHTAEPVEGNLEKARKLVEEAGLSERVTFHLTTGEEMLRGLAEQIDLAFLDSNLETRMGELRELLPKLKSNGLIAVHDTNTFHVQHGGPRNEILAFAAAKGLQVVNFDTPRGLMLLRRKP